MSNVPLSRAGLFRARLWRLGLALVRGSLSIALVLALFLCAARGWTERTSRQTHPVELGPTDELALIGARDSAERAARGARRLSLAQPGRGWSMVEAIDAGWITEDDASRVELVATPEGVRVLPRPVRAGFARDGGAR